MTKEIVKKFRKIYPSPSNYWNHQYAAAGQ